MRRSRIVMVAIGVACAASMGLAMRHRDASAPTTVEVKKTTPLLEAFNWPKGAVYTYDFAWTASSMGEVEGQAAAGDFELSGQLVLASLGTSDGVTTLSARILPTNRHTVNAFGGELLPTDDAMRATFEGREALLDVDPRGVVRSIFVPADAPAIYKTIAHGLLTATQVTLPKVPVTTWTATEFSSGGHALVRYAVDPSDQAKLRRDVEAADYQTGTPTKSRRRAATQDYAVRGEITLDPSGCVASLRQTEAMAASQGVGEAPQVVARSTFEMHLSGRSVDLAVIAARDLTKYESHPPGDVAGKATDLERDERLAKGMRIEDTRLTIGTYDGSKLPQGFTTRAAAMLRAHPEYDAEIAAAFATAHEAGRSLAMDLLSAAGDARAQATMRDLLDREDVRSDPDRFAALVQRFTFVGNPEAASLEYVLLAYQAASKRNDTTSARASAFAMGSLLRKLAITSPSRLTKRAHAKLVADLHAATDVDAKNALLAALGNAGLPESRGPIMSLANDDRGSTRAQVALSLRKISGQEAIDATFKLLTDEDTQVASAALRSLGQRHLDATTTDRLAEAVMSGSVKTAIDKSVVALIGQADAISPTVEKMLRFVLERDAEAFPEIVGTINDLLARARRG